MPEDILPITNLRAGDGAFLTTRWSVVLRAGGEESPEALSQLCCDYWYPLYAYVRRRGFSPHDAQDLTQGFFHELIEGSLLDRASADRGRFRSYLLGALQNFIANEHRRQQAVKRGGRAQIISIDDREGETRLACEPVEELTPERLYERNWAFSLLERVLVRLKTDYEQAGRAALFTALQPYLAGKCEMPDYGEVGRPLSLSAGAVAVAIHRMRRRYGDLLREEIAHTVASPEEVEAEIAYLLGVVARV